MREKETEREEESIVQNETERIFHVKSVRRHVVRTLSWPSHANIWINDQYNPQTSRNCIYYICIYDMIWEVEYNVLWAAVWNETLYVGSKMELVQAKRGMEMDRSYTASGDWGNSEMAMNSSMKSNCNDPSSSGDTTSEQVHLILVRSSGIILHSCLAKTWSLVVLGFWHGWCDPKAML